MSRVGLRAPMLAACLIASQGLIGEAFGQTCTTAATALAFGPYQPLTGAATTSAATVTVTCNPGTVSVLVSYSVQLGAGGSGAITARSMAGPGTRLGYQIYTDSLYSQIWGDGTAGTSTVTGGYLLGVQFPVQQTYTAYGRIPGGSRVNVGSYTDTVMVLLTY